MPTLSRPRRPDPAGSASPSGEDLAAFLRRHIRAQYDIIRRKENGVRAGEEVPLHDMRVAIRRLRTLLRTFKQNLARTAAADIEARLDRLLKALGPARDVDVWLLFLKRHPELGRRTRAGPYRHFLAAQHDEKQTHQRRVTERMDGKAYRALKADLDHLLDRDLRPGTPRVAGAPVTVAGRDALRKALKRIRKRARGLPDLPPEKMHKLRIACRRARYLAEFFAGTLLSVRLEDLAFRLKAVQDVLGDMHDQDVYLARLRAHRPRPPRDLVKKILRRRRRDLARFEKTWERWRQPRFQRRLKTSLKEDLAASPLVSRPAD